MGEELYYIQDTRQYADDLVIWWRKDSRGYTTDIELAQTYSKAETEVASRTLNGRHPVHVAWPKILVDDLRSKTIEREKLNGFKNRSVILSPFRKPNFPLNRASEGRRGA